MGVAIIGARTELGRLLVRSEVATARRNAHINVSGQQANSLLHDGHAWKEFARTALAGTRRAIRAARTAGSPMLVHASFAFVDAVAHGARLNDPLRSLVEAILECEMLALSGSVPACVVRLGYLYGPESANLRAYRTAFNLGRPYWSGPPKSRQYHLHQFDAVAALLAAARRGNENGIFYATDGHPLPFMKLMDAFAHRVGRKTPLHLPLIAKPLARVIIAEEHMQQTALSMPTRAPSPPVPGWKPKFADYRKGLDQVVAAWEEGAGK